MVVSTLRWSLEEEITLRYVVLGSACFSVCGACVIILSALRFRELSKRFFAIRLIFFLALTDCFAATFNIIGAAVDIQQLVQPGNHLPLLCALQTIGLLYFNLASILWTSCFAFTLYRDAVPSHRRHALRKYELYFHALCWPLPAVLTGSCAYFGHLEESENWCAVGFGCSSHHLNCFYGPLLAAFTFNLVIYTAVLSHSRERRISRITSLYLLSFALVWMPSLLLRLKSLFVFANQPAFIAAAIEALCMPLQGALNAIVYGWSLPSIRDVYRTMLLGPDGLDSVMICQSESALASRSPSYSPPDCEVLPNVGLSPVSLLLPNVPGAVATCYGDRGADTLVAWRGEELPYSHGQCRQYKCHAHTVADRG